MEEEGKLNENPKIIGRESEQVALQSMFASVKDGKGGIVLISGEAGVGKTLLAEESLAQSDLSVFTARSTDDGHPAYGAIVTLFRNCSGQKSTKQSIWGRWHRALRCCFPN